MFYIGCHLSKEGGYYAAGQKALEIGANTFQFFTRNPRGRASSKDTDLEDVKALDILIKENSMHAPLAHAPYIYNPCAKDENIRQYTAETMKKELELLENIDGAMYNFHPGNHVGQGEDVAVKYISDMLNSVLKPGFSTIVLLETMAGKGTEMGRTFEELRRIIDLVEPEFQDKLGVCLDTCHIHDGGYPISESPDKALEEFDNVLGLDRLKAVHLNDSKNVVGAKKDRHEKIGEGYISLDSMAYLINHPALRDVPFYLETPNELDGYQKEIALLKSLRKED